MTIAFSDDRNGSDRDLVPFLVPSEKSKPAVIRDMLVEGDDQGDLVVGQRRAVDIGDHKHLGDPVGGDFAGVLESQTDDLFGGLVVVDQTSVDVGYLDRNRHQARPLLEQDHLDRVLSQRANLRKKR
jgi:hypothetical protein